MTGATTTAAITTPNTTTMAANTTTATTTEIPFKDGYLKDEYAQRAEPIQRPTEGRPFLWTGRKAEVGQRTETQVITSNGKAWCRLSGVVTHVGDMPTLDEWRMGNSSQLPEGIKSQTLPVEEQLVLRDEYIERYGTLHGQSITSYSVLNFDFYDRQDMLPFKSARVYRITYKADENMSFFWIVSKIEDVTDDIVSEEELLPEVFKKWSGGLRVYARSVSF